MALNPYYTSERLPSTSLEAIQQFEDKYLAVLMAAAPTNFADQFAEKISTSSPLVKFPVTQLATKFTRYTGEQRHKTSQEKSFSIQAEEFQEGYEAELAKLFQEQFAYRRWSEQPGRLAVAEEVFRQKAVSALLEAGQSTLFLDTGENFFDTALPANLFESKGTFSNYVAGGTAITIANLEAQVTAGKEILDENGDRLGVDYDTIIVPSPKVESTRILLGKEYLATAAGTTNEPNPYKGRFNVIENPYLTDVNDWYLVDSKLVAQGFTPWIIMRQQMPGSLGMRWFDESSDFFKTTGRIKCSAHIWYGFGLGLPHAIRKIVGA